MIPFVLKELLNLWRLYLFRPCFKVEVLLELGGASIPQICYSIGNTTLDENKKYLVYQMS